MIDHSNSNLHQNVKSSTVTSGVFDREYSFSQRKLQTITQQQTEEIVNNVLVENNISLQIEFENFPKKPDDDCGEFKYPNKETKLFEGLDIPNESSNVDVSKSFIFSQRALSLKSSKNDGDFNKEMEEIVRSLEEEICEYEKEFETILCDMDENDELEKKLEKLKKLERCVEFELDVIKERESTNEFRMFSYLLTKILQRIESLRDCMYENINFNIALTEIKSINHLICSSDSEKNIFQLKVVTKSVELMLSTMKNSTHKLKLRRWLDISMDKCFKYLQTEYSNEMRDMYYEEVEYYMQNIIEKNNKFQNIVCDGLCEAEVILERLHEHEGEINELNCKIDQYEKTPFFENNSSFERGKDNLKILLNDIQEKISELSEEIENEKTFIMNFVDIWYSWRRVVEFNKKDIDVSELKIWKKDGQHFLDQWSLFKVEYCARPKKYIVTNELLDKFSSNGSDRLVDDYKEYVDKIIRKVTDESFRFSLVGHEIEGIIAMKNLDETITEIEESVVNDSDININIIVGEDIENLINELDSLHINKANKRQNLTIQIKDLHPSDDTSGIIDDHEDDRTITSEMTIGEGNSFENDEIDDNKKSVESTCNTVCITGLRIVFSTLIFTLLLFFTLVLYYGREEVLPCCLRELWWTQFRRNGRTPF